MKKYTKEAILQAARAIAEGMDKNTFSEAIPFAERMNKAAKSLQRRYENECSYEWANTPQYIKRTENMEAKIIKECTEFGFDMTSDVNEKRAGAWFRLQTDPRGWALVLIVNGSEYRLGGE